MRVAPSYAARTGHERRGETVGQGDDGDPGDSYVLFAKGDRLECTVTPTDGELQAASKSVRSKVR